MSLCQAVFSQTDGLEGDGSAEAQYAYYPATIAEATSGTMVTTVQASDTLLGQTTPTGKRCPCLRPENGVTTDRDGALPAAFSSECVYVTQGRSM